MSKSHTISHRNKGWKKKGNKGKTGPPQVLETIQPYCMVPMPGLRNSPGIGTVSFFFLGLAAVKGRQ